jgi:hypothetical protein
MWAALACALFGCAGKSALEPSDSGGGSGNGGGAGATATAGAASSGGSTSTGGSSATAGAAGDVSGEGGTPGQAGATGGDGPTGGVAGDLGDCPTDATSVRDGDVSLTKQADVEKLRGVARIEGNLAIQGDVADLSPLRCLVEVGGDVTITDTSELGSVDGLESLELVGGALNVSPYCEDEVCYGNQSLTSVALPALRAAGEIYFWESCSEFEPCTPVLRAIDLPELRDVGSVTLQNSALEHVAFGRLERVSQKFYVVRSEALVEITGLDHVTELGGLTLSLVALERLDFSPVSQIPGILELDESGAGLDLGFLSSVEEIGQLRLVNAKYVFDELSSLRRIDTELNLLGETGTTLDWLDVEFGDECNITLQATELETLEGLGELPTAGVVTLWDNAALLSLAGLAGLRSAATVGLSGSPLITTLQGLESLEAVRNLSIVGSPLVTTLEPLAGLQTVEEVRFENLGIANLQGLDSLTEVGLLVLATNPALQNVDGCPSLQTLGGILLYQNPMLTDLADFASAAGADPGEMIRIIDNDALTTLDGLDGLRGAPTREIYIDGNELLESLRALANIDAVWSLTITNNPRLHGCEIDWLEASIGAQDRSPIIYGNGSQGTCSP